MTEKELKIQVKLITPCYTSFPEEIVFKEIPFKELPKIKWLTVKEIEEFGVLDVNRYKKDALQEMINAFVVKYDFLTIKNKIR